MSDASVIVKVQVLLTATPHFRKLTVRSFSDVTEAMQAMYHCDPRSLVLEYRDEDNDLIRLSTDGEWQVLVDAARAHNTFPRLSVRFDDESGLNAVVPLASTIWHRDPAVAATPNANDSLALTSTSASVAVGPATTMTGTTDAATATAPAAATSDAATAAVVSTATSATTPRPQPETATVAVGTKAPETENPPAAIEVPRSSTVDTAVAAEEASQPPVQEFVLVESPQATETPIVAAAEVVVPEPVAQVAAEAAAAPEAVQQPPRTLSPTLRPALREMLPLLSKVYNCDAEQAILTLTAGVFRDAVKLSVDFANNTVAFTVRDEVFLQHAFGFMVERVTAAVPEGVDPANAPALAEAEEIALLVTAFYPALAAGHYNLAVLLTKRGKYAQALAELEAAVDAGMAPDIVHADTDFAALRTMSRFRLLGVRGAPQALHTLLDMFPALSLTEADAVLNRFQWNLPQATEFLLSQPPPAAASTHVVRK